MHERRPNPSIAAGVLEAMNGQQVDSDTGISAADKANQLLFQSGSNEAAVRGWSQSESHGWKTS